MTRAVPRLVQPSYGSWVILTLPVSMYLPPSFANQRGFGNANRSTSLPRRMFSSTGPSLTTVGGTYLRVLDFFRHSETNPNALRFCGIPKVNPSRLVEPNELIRTR